MSDEDKIDIESEPLSEPNSPPASEKSPSQVPSQKSQFNPLIGVIIFLVIVIIGLLSFLLIYIASSSKDPVVYLNPQKLVDQRKDSSDGRMIVGGDSDKSGDKRRNVCETPECITLAHQLHNWRNPKVDPCVDFYEYSCGRYMEHTSATSTIAAENSEILKRLIKEFLRKPNATSLFKSENTLRLLYQKCEALKDRKIFRTESQKMMVEIFENIRKIGAWPVLDPNWDPKVSNFSLNDFLVNMAKLHMTLNGIFELTPQKKLVLFGPTAEGFSTPPDMVLQITMEILEANGISNFDERKLNNDIQDVENFRRNLLSIQDFKPVPSTYSELKKRIPSVDFDRIIQNLMDPPGRVDWKVLETKLVAENADVFFGEAQNLDTILNETQPRVIANYLIFNYLSTVASYIDPKLAAQRECDKFISTQVPQATLLLFVRHFFDRENIRAVGALVDQIKESYKQMLEKSTWISETSKKRAIRKVEMMTKLIGYPENQGWEERVEAAFGKFELSSSSADDTLLSWMSRIESIRVQEMIDLALIESPFVPSKHITAMNANYVRAVNHLNMMAPYIDEPHFDTTYPKYAQLGSTGYTLAHEMGHAFDAGNLGYDEEGRWTKPWADDDVKEYFKRVDCLRRQYDSYDDPEYGRNLDGKKTLTEMTADQLGMEANWATHKRLDMTKEQDIIGFEGRHPDEMFFRVAALSSCEPPTHLPLKKVLQNVHPQSRFRINGVFSNMVSFAETFKCPVGTPMNPSNKCLIF